MDSLLAAVVEISSTESTSDDEHESTSDIKTDAESADDARPTKKQRLVSITAPCD